MTHPKLAALQTVWERLAPRERKLLVMAISLVALALTWLWLLAPALQTLRTTNAQHTKLDAELAHMQTLALEAKQLQARASPTAKDAENWLLQSVKKLGKSTLSLPTGGLQAGTAQVSLVGADATQLASWLTDARTVAGLAPTEAHWKRTGSEAASAQWSGSITLKLSTSSAP